MTGKRVPFRTWQWVLLGASLLVLALFAGAVFLVTTGRAAGGLFQPAATVLARDLTVSGPDFAAGQAKGPLRKDAGLALSLPGSAVYTSPLILAPLPFSDLGCLREANLPAGSTLLLEVRTSPDADGDRWSPWTALQEEDDQPPLPSGQVGTKLLGIPQRDGVHQRLQYRLSMAALSAGNLPALKRLTFTFIDARAGPTTAEIVAAKGRAQPEVVGQPPIISRVEWGCPEGEESPRWEPEYQLVTHIIIHHTATPNDDDDWAARVRAIWYYHANTRGWGDIGYNFLVDPLGNVYEGRAGGEDVIGGHAYDYNPGTMGVGNLGDYTSAPVPEPLRQGMEALIAWKCSERGIDPLGSSFNNFMVYPHIAGHRDVGPTACPGDVLYGLIPTIRQQVQDILDQQEEQIAIDELDPGFSHSQANWYDSCGWRDHSWWTHTTTDPNISTNWGIWRPNLPQSGWYEVFAYVPSCTGGDLPDYTTAARYRVYYWQGGTTVVVNQSDERGRWVSLGTYRFPGGTAGYVYLDDIAGDHWKSLWYDGVRWVFRSEWVAPPPLLPLQSPPADTWVESRTVALSWTIPPTATLDGVHLVVASTPGLNSPLLDLRLDPVSQYVLSLSHDYPALYWSVQGHNRAGDGPLAPVRRFGVDTAAPVSAARGIFRTESGAYFLTWGGTDSGSGVAGYTVQARDGTEGPWQDLWSDTLLTGGAVQVTPGVTRYFRVNARDALGHVEPVHEGNGDLSSDQAVLLGYTWYQAFAPKGFQPPTPQRTATPTPTATPSPSPVPSPQPTASALPTVPPTPSSSPTPGPTALPTAVPTPTRLPSPTPAGGLSYLPDLRVLYLRSSQSTPFDCGRPTGIAVQVGNLGLAPAGRFELLLQGTGLESCRWQFEGLQPGEYAERVCTVVLLNTVVTATVDLENAVSESNEDNNALAVPLSVLALPTCTPRPGP